MQHMSVASAATRSRRAPGDQTTTTLRLILIVLVGAALTFGAVQLKGEIQDQERESQQAEDLRLGYPWRARHAPGSICLAAGDPGGGRRRTMGPARSGQHLPRSNTLVRHAPQS